MLRGVTWRRRRELLPGRPRRSPDFGREPELTKIVEATWHRLAVADDGKSTNGAKAQLVERFAEILEEKDARIRELEAQLAKLTGSGVTKVRSADIGVDYCEHLRRIAATDPTPARRIAALGMLTD